MNKDGKTFTIIDTKKSKSPKLSKGQKSAENLKETNLVYAENLDTY